MIEHASDPGSSSILRSRLWKELRALLLLGVAGLLFGYGLRRLEAEAHASDPCTDSYLGFAFRDEVRRIEGEGPLEGQLYWPLQAILSISHPVTLQVRGVDDVDSFTLELEPESGP